MAILVVHDVDDDPHAVRLEPNCEIGKLPRHKVELAWANVGKRHARFEQIGALWWVIDLHSVDGTFVNGERVRKSRPLTSGDRIVTGEVYMLFFEDGLAPPLPVEEACLVLDFRPTARTIVTLASSLPRPPARIEGRWFWNDDYQYVGFEVLARFADGSAKSLSAQHESRAAMMRDAGAKIATRLGIPFQVDETTRPTFLERDLARGQLDHESNGFYFRPDGAG